jgi:phosphatidylinositol alpha-1,6-mannosyltransferase
MTGTSVKSLLISGSYFPPQTGGISHVMHGVAAALGPERVCCLTGVSAGLGTGRALECGVYRRPEAFHGTRVAQAVALSKSVAQIMVRESPRVVQLATLFEGSLGLGLRRWLKLPFVVYAHGNEILDGLKADWPKPRLALRQADRVLAVSEFTANLVKKADVPPERITIVRPGCEVERFRPRDSTLDLRQKLLGSRYTDQIILTVGGLVPRKGHDMVIRALPRLLRRVPKLTYVVVGDGPARPHLEALATTTGIRDRVVFTGNVADEHLPDMYAVSDVFVMPSREDLDACDVEGFGLVFLEANACGKPVIGGRSGGIADAVVDGVTGFLVDPRDEDDIANSLARVLNDGALAARLGDLGRVRVVREFTWKRVAAQVDEIVASIARGDSSQGRRAAA